MTTGKRRGQKSEQDDSERFAASSANYLLRHLFGVATAIRSQVGQEIEARGHEMTPSMSYLLVNIPVAGIGMSDLAARLSLSLQRTGQLVGDLEDFGYVERVADENDGRAKRVVFTRRGRKLLADIDEVDTVVTREISAVLGEQQFARFCRDLEVVDRALGAGGEVLALGPR